MAELTDLSALSTKFSDLLRIGGDSDQLVEETISIVRSSANMKTAEVLSENFWLLAQERPLDIDKTSALFAQVIQSTQSLSVQNSEWGSRPFPFFFDLYLHESMKDALFETDKDEPSENDVVPDNPVLIAAMATAFAWKHDLLKPSSTTIAFTAEGLHLPNYTVEVGREEVNVLGSCLQLVVAGRAVTERVIPNNDFRTVESALRELQNKGASWSPAGARLISKAIDLAANDFRETLSSSEAWKILFSKA